MYFKKSLKPWTLVEFPRYLEEYLAHSDHKFSTELKITVYSNYFSHKQPDF